MLGLRVIPQRLMTTMTESIYQSVCEERELGRRPILQNIQRLKPHDELFYEHATLGGRVSVRAMLDSGSMACTLSSSDLPQLLQQAILKTPSWDPLMLF